MKKFARKKKRKLSEISNHNSVMIFDENVVLNEKTFDEEFRDLEILYQKSIIVDNQFREYEDLFLELLQNEQKEREIRCCKKEMIV